MLIVKSSKVQHSQSILLFYVLQSMHILLAMNSITLPQLWQIYTHLISVSTLTLKFGLEFFITSMELPSVLSELASISICPKSLLSNNKSQIHQPLCQFSHPWATEHSPTMPQDVEFPTLNILSKSPELWKSFFESYLLKFSFII